jgi:hypothetical protein
MLTLEFASAPQLPPHRPRLAEAKKNGLNMLNMDLPSGYKKQFAMV